jgi:ABC-type multidrug transport system ATPase subunit
VWETIEEMKQERVVVLTTHSMEEADRLGDEIVIMNQGQLRAVGSSLFLKSHFGRGYHLTLLGPPPAMRDVLSTVEDMLPGVEVLAESAGQVHVSLPQMAISRLPDFFRWLEAGGAPIKEWSVSNTTLSEVFLRLCEQNVTVNEADLRMRYTERTCQVSGEFQQSVKTNEF